MFLKANDLTQGSKTPGRKPRVSTTDFTFCDAAASNYLHGRINVTKNHLMKTKQCNEKYY